MKLLADFKAYLQQRHYTRSSIKQYARSVYQFQVWTQRQEVLPTQVRYADLLLFLQYCQKQGQSRNHQRQHTTALRHLFRMLRRQQQRGAAPMNHNPAEGLFITRRATRLPHDLLPMNELLSLYQSYAGSSLHQLMLGLIIFQALRREELSKLRIEHLHLKEGKVVVPATSGGNRRVLKLSTEQIMPLYEWIAGKRADERLFLSPKGSSNLSNVVQRLNERVRLLNPEVKHLRQIRQSVIAHWLKSQDVRQVQYMAGHKWVSSTERYQQTDLEDLQNKLDKYHPLG